MKTHCCVNEQIKLIRIVKRLPGPAAPDKVTDQLVLPYALRQKARQRVRLQSGQEAGLFLDRGDVLRDGDLLSTEEGACLQVVAAQEQVSIARADDPLLLARLAYHLGNRHVALQILPDRLIYLHDHVLDEMVRGLGAVVEITALPFEPEEGAYHAGGCHHSH
jgi:urease accessory protein